MTSSILCLFGWLLLLIALPILVLGWATESRRERVLRWRRQGLSQQAIANRLSCSRHQVRKLLAA
jgi:DNA-binding CsgD family transcriptional regulator